MKNTLKISILVVIIGLFGRLGFAYNTSMTPFPSPPKIPTQYIDKPSEVTFSFTPVSGASEYHWYRDEDLTDRIVSETSNSLTVFVSKTTIFYVTSVNGSVETQATLAKAILSVPDDTNLNWVHTMGFDQSEAIFTESKAFFGLDGKALQSQTKNFEANQVLASQGLRDEYDREVLSTLPAPINKSSFQYKADFIQNSSGEFYDHAHFSGVKKNNPEPVGEEIGSLGWYYSDNNTFESRVPSTNYPYSRTDFYEDGSGEIKRSAQPGNTLRMGAGHEAITKTLPIGTGELPHYIALRKLILPGSTPNDNLDQVYKQVNIDPNGKESVAYIGESGDAIATAVSILGKVLPITLKTTRTNESGTEVPAPTEFRVPIGNPVTITNNSLGHFPIYDKLSENSNPIETIHTNVILDPGIYIINGSQSITYNLNYSDHAYNFYDNAGRLAASIAPKGLAAIIVSGTIPANKDLLTFTTFYTYDFQGRLIEMKEPDAGVTEYIYRKDGSIRFSRNAEQALNGKYSYTSYDKSGRPVESGEYNGTGAVAYESTQMTAMLENTGEDFDQEEKADWVKTSYDLPDSRLASIPDLVGYTQEYLYGAVSYTENENVITWYSYDEFGQVTWIAMQYDGLNDQIFTIDYEYDYFGNVTQVAFQRNDAIEAFHHHYTYEKENRLSAVYTTLNGNFAVDSSGDPTNLDTYLHARYFYYMHGPLKRIEYADDLQGIDYTYTAQGWLKSINNPTASVDSNDNVGSATTNKDAFGMSLEYYNNDYHRPSSGIAPLVVSTSYDEQYSGNIRAQHWSRNFMGVLQHYPDDVVLDEYDESEVTAGNSITLEAGFDTGGNEFTTTIDPDATFLPADQTDNMYVYDYDDKYQLKNALYASNGAWDPTEIANKNAVRNLTYDENGNIITLDRYDDKSNTPVDAFAYNYDKLNSENLPTNMLTSVGGYTSSDYQYNDIGQLIESNRVDIPTQKMSYDVTGKVTEIRDGSDALIYSYKYDDRGFRILKRDEANNKETWYVRDASGNIVAIYEKDGAATQALTELPIYGSSKIGTSFRNTLRHKYNYELTDHLGNVRAIVSKLKFMETATMEDDRAQYEEATFSNIATSRHNSGNDINSTYQGNKVALLNGALVNGTPNVIGPGRQLQVSAGDKVIMDVYARYEDNTNGGGGFPGGILSILAGSFSPTIGGESTTTSSVLTTGLAGISSFGSTGVNVPKAYVQYLLFDKGFNHVTTGQNPYKRVTSAAKIVGSGSGISDAEYLTLDVDIPQDGYIFIYVVNETSGTNVYFDDLTIRQLGVDITQTTDYYPFGSVLSHWESNNNDKYRFGYQGEYAEKDDETGYNHFEAREYDSKIGRFTAMDPSGQFVSPYNGMGNSPINGVDPDGRDFFRGQGGGIRWFDNSSGGFSDLDGNSWENVGTNYISINVLPGGTSFTTTFQQFGNEIDGFSVSYNTTADFNVGIDQVQGILDGMGLVPVVGEPFDAISGIISFAQGNYGTAALSLAAMAPIGGIWVTGGKFAWSSRRVSKAATQLQNGADAVTMVNRSEAEELFLGLYQGHGYKNTTGWNAKQTKDFFGSKNGTYHWDLDDIMHGGVPHLQVHDNYGKVTRIFFGQ